MDNITGQILVRIPALVENFAQSSISLVKYWQRNKNWNNAVQEMNVTESILSPV